VLWWRPSLFLGLVNDGTACMPMLATTHTPKRVHPPMLTGGNRLPERANSDWPIWAGNRRDSKRLGWPRGHSINRKRPGLPSHYSVYKKTPASPKASGERMQRAYLICSPSQASQRRTAQQPHQRERQQRYQRHRRSSNRDRGHSQGEHQGRSPHPGER